MTQPSGLRNLLRAAAGALPFVPRGDSLPDRTLTVDAVRAYQRKTGQPETGRIDKTLVALLGG